jgi:hypothetical protein
MIKIFEGEVDAQKIRLAIVSSKTKKFQYLSSSEIEEYLKTLR